MHRFVILLLLATLSCSSAIAADVTHYGNQNFIGGNVGIGTTTTGSRFDVKGFSNTSATYTAKFQNSDASGLLYVRDDGYIFSGYTTIVPTGSIIVGTDKSFPMTIAQAGITRGDGKVYISGLLLGSTSSTETSLDDDTLLFHRLYSPSIKQSAAHNDSYAAHDLSILAQNAYVSALSFLSGGNIKIIGGNGASSSSGDAHGGNVEITGGTGYGTGHQGNVVIDANEIIMIMDNAPTSATDPCTVGAVAFNTDYMFRCVATNTWKRAALSTW